MMQLVCLITCTNFIGITNMINILRCGYKLSLISIDPRYISPKHLKFLRLLPKGCQQYPNDLLLKSPTVNLPVFPLFSCVPTLSSRIPAFYSLV